jgi:hypothetical protein
MRAVPLCPVMPRRRASAVRSRANCFAPSSARFSAKQNPLLFFIQGKRLKSAISELGPLLKHKTSSRGKEHKSSMRKYYEFKLCSVPAQRGLGPCCSLLSPGLDRPVRNNQLCICTFFSSTDEEYRTNLMLYSERDKSICLRIFANTPPPDPLQALSARSTESIEAEIEEF